MKPDHAMRPLFDRLLALRDECYAASKSRRLKRLATVCAPVRKRGWYRKLANESRRIYAELEAACRQPDAGVGSTPAEILAVDPVLRIVAPGATRDA